MLWSGSFKCRCAVSLRAGGPTFAFYVWLGSRAELQSTTTTTATHPLTTPPGDLLTAGHWSKALEEE